MIKFYVYHFKSAGNEKEFLTVIRTEPLFKPLPSNLIYHEIMFEDDLRLQHLKNCSFES